MLIHNSYQIGLDYTLSKLQNLTVLSISVNNLQDDGDDINSDVSSAIVYLFNWRGARERHTLKWSGEQLYKEILDIDLQNKIKH